MATTLLTPRGWKEMSSHIAAHLAGIEKIGLGKVYGDVANGTAVEAIEVPSVDHVRIIWSRRTRRRASCDGSTECAGFGAAAHAHSDLPAALHFPAGPDLPGMQRPNAGVGAS